MNHKSRTRIASGAINSTNTSGIIGSLIIVAQAHVFYPKFNVVLRGWSKAFSCSDHIFSSFQLYRRLALHRCLDWLVSTMRCACTLLLIGQRHRQSGALRPTLLECIRHETCRPQLSCTASKSQHLSCWPRESAKFFPLYHIGYSSHPPPNVPHRPPVDQRTECSCYFVFTLHSLH
jgi:hypothetical protein